MEHKPEIIFPHLGLVIDKLSKVAFTLFGVEVYWYAVTMVSSIFLGWLLARHTAKKTGQNPEMYDMAVSLGILLSFLCGRLYYVVFAGLPMSQLFNFRNGGLAMYGSVVGILITGYVVARIYKASALVILDTCVPSIVLGQVIGRWGNFVNREAFGTYTDGLFAMRILATQAKAGVSKVVEDSAGYIQVHPTFLYESALNLVLLGVLVLCVRPRARFKGELLCWYALGYGVVRFFVEGLRTDQLMLFGTGIAVSQAVAVLSVAVAIYVLYKSYKKVPM